MHPRQASLLEHVSEVAIRTSGKSAQKQAAQPLLWKYEDPEGKIFYLEEKQLTIKSPFSGKSFSAKPTKHTLNQVGKEMKEDAVLPEKTASEVVDPWKA